LWDGSSVAGDDAAREVVVRRVARPVIDAKWLRRSGEVAFASLYSSPMPSKNSPTSFTTAYFETPNAPPRASTIVSTADEVVRFVDPVVASDA
jgi:hypothetical protein